MSIQSTYQVSPPDPFEFSAPASWSKWLQRFQRYRKASGLCNASDDEQVNSFIYLMGEKAEDIFQSFGLTEKDKKIFSIVIERFEKHFVVKKNTIFERAQFNQRSQQDGESVNDFITALYALAEQCEYGCLHDELIRDRIVVGIRDKGLSEKLQLDPDLTLTKAIERVRLSESIKQQQDVLHRPNKLDSVNAIHHRGKPKVAQHKEKSHFQDRTASKKSDTSNNRMCKWCGKIQHSRDECPAKNEKCVKCGKVGHYGRVCRSIENKFRSKKSDIAFLGTITRDSVSDKWSVPIKIQDQVLVFKIDSGADHTVIPTSVWKQLLRSLKMSKPEKKLCGPDKRPLKVDGMIYEEICYKDKRFYEEIYIIDELQTCLLGKPAIEAFGLGPNIQCISQVTTLNPEKEFPDLFKGLGKTKDVCSIQLEPNSVPRAITAPRRIPIPLLKKTEAEIKRMLQLGVIAPVNEPTEWCSAMVVVPKSNGTVRICVDLIELNKCVKRQWHPLPTVEYSLGLLGGAKIFTKLDANSGFWQIPLEQKSSFLTTFITPFGRYRFLRLPFGISSAPEIFQRRMNLVLENMAGTVCHMDDILIWGSNQAEHDERVREVLKKLKNSGITLNDAKCQFSVKSVKFLGHYLNGDGIHPDSDKIEAVKSLKSPTNKTELKRLLGMANYLARFVPNFAEIVSPLTSLLSDKNKFEWSTVQEKAFENLKATLSSSPVLKIYNPNETSIVTADASSYGLGATLRQKQDNGELAVIAYASRTMTPTEQRYAQIEKEALGLAWACDKFRDYIMGSHFMLETDHKPLIPIFTNKNLDDLSPRLQRLRLRMMRYSYTIFHTPGKYLLAADALSRNPQQTTKGFEDDFEGELKAYVNMVLGTFPSSPQRLNEIKVEQEADSTCKLLQQYAVNGWPENRKEVNQDCLPFWQHRFEITIQNGLLMKGCRIIIPKTLRLTILEKIHEGHLGITKCRARARTSVYWPGINKEIEEKVQNCTECIKESTNRHQPLLPSEFPSRPWEKVALDLFKFGGCWYLLLTDYYSRYPEIAKLERLTSSEVILHCKSFFARHGVPDVVRSDCGSQFESLKTSEFYKFAKTYGFCHVTSSPHFAQSNGFVESAVKIVKLRFKKSADPYLALMAYRATPLENGYSPAELLMNRKLKTTLPISEAQLQPQMLDKKGILRKEENRINRQRKYFDSSHGVRTSKELNPGQTVWLTDRRTPGTVERKAKEPRSYYVKSGGRSYRRNRKHLIPAKNLSLNLEASDSIDIDTDVDTETTNDSQDSSLRDTASPAAPNSYTTRSGRVVRQPNRLDL